MTGLSSIFSISILCHVVSSFDSDSEIVAEEILVIRIQSFDLVLLTFYLGVVVSYR